MSSVGRREGAIRIPAALSVPSDVLSPNARPGTLEPSLRSHSTRSPALGSPCSMAISERVLESPVVDLPALCPVFDRARPGWGDGE